MSGETFIPLRDMAAWSAFYRANAEALENHDHALAAAMNCELVIGGGAAPLVRVGFVDGETP